MNKRLSVIVAIFLLVIAGSALFFYFRGHNRYKADTLEGVASNVTVMENGSGVLWGKLTDENGLPLSGVSVNVNGLVAVSDPAGWYEFSSMNPGFYVATFFRGNGALASLQDSQIAISPNSSPPTNFILTSDPNYSDFVGIYHFSETSGASSADSSSNSNHAALTNTAIINSYSTSAGKAREFNGKNSFAKVSDSPSLNPAAGQGLTLSTWVKIDSAASDFSRIIDKSIQTNESGAANIGGYSLMLGGASNKTKGKLIFYVYGGNGQPTPEYRPVITTDAVPTNTWINVTTTYDGTTSKIYIKGTEAGTKTFTTKQDIRKTTDSLNLGRHAITNNQYFKGAMDDVRIYDRALTKDEVGTISK